MAETALEYVERTSAGGWRLCNSRVALESIILLYWEGKSAEAIAEEFPSLNPEQVYGAIAFYLHNRAEIDRYLGEREQQWEQVRRESESRNGSLLQRIRASKRTG